MAADTRDRMVAAASVLFRDQGYDGTGFRDVVESAGVARGVIYHHFPDGKAQLGAAVVDAESHRLAGAIERICAEQPPDRAIRAITDIITDRLVELGPRPGCPVAAVTMAADDEDGRMRAAAAAFFDRTAGAVADCLQRDGVAAVDAESYATMAVAACEGAVLLCRAARGVEPMRRTADALLAGAARLPRSAPS